MKPTAITIHCSDSPPGRGDNAETIHRWHKERGWAGIGYHYVITDAQDSNTEPGRPPYWTGAHVRNHNKGNIGICLIGRGFDDFTQGQIVNLISLVRWLMEEYDIPVRAVKGHYEYDSAKTCPNMDMDGFRELLL